MAFTLAVAGFPDGGTIPKRYTGEGADVSPALEWSGQPEATRSFALIVDDPDAPVGTWNHWLLWDIPVQARALAEDAGRGGTGVSGTNDFGRAGYGGPMPPKGHGAHRYYFRLYSVGVASLGLKAGARRAELDRALRGNVRAEAVYMGRYERLR